MPRILQTDELHITLTLFPNRYIGITHKAPRCFKSSSFLRDSGLQTVNHPHTHSHFPPPWRTWEWNLDLRPFYQRSSPRSRIFVGQSGQLTGVNWVPRPRQSSIRRILSRQITFWLVDLYPSRHNSQWWHANSHDTRLHVTVRYDRRVPATRRVHIYQDGSANLFPHNPARTRTALTEQEGSDGSVEFSDQDD